MSEGALELFSVLEPSDLDRSRSRERDRELGGFAQFCLDRLQLLAESRWRLLRLTDIARLRLKLHRLSADPILFDKLKFLNQLL